jgi:hypothetical protein
VNQRPSEAPDDVRGTARKGRPAAYWAAGRTGFIVAIVLALAGLGVIAWRVADSNDDNGPPKSDGSASAQPLKTPYVDNRLGIAVRIPAGWSTPSKGRIARFATDDRSMSLAVLSAKVAPLTVLQQAAEADLTRRFKPARVVGRGKGRVGGRPARTSEILGTGKGGPVRVLVAATSAGRRSYVFEVLSANPPRAARLLEAKAMLADVRFTG